MSRTDGPGRKAYHDHAFINSREARSIRVLAEYLEPEKRFDRLGVKDTIIFFGSARIRDQESARAELAAAERDGGDVGRARMRLEMSRYYEDARELSRRLSQWSQELEEDGRHFVVCTGGGPGIMEAANRGAHDAGALNIGLSISIPAEEFQNRYVTPELAFEFHYFFMRKFWFTYMAKGVVVMPGGFGTMDELFELMTLIQTLKMKKRPPVVLFGTRFWNDVLNLEALARYGTIDPGDVDLFLRTDSVDEAFEHLTAGLRAYPAAETGPSL
jgi:uncharacterized protein (TIGR00730 family)